MRPLSGGAQVHSPCLRVGAFSTVRIPRHGTYGKDFDGEAATVVLEEHPSYCSVAEW